MNAGVDDQRLPRGIASVPPGPVEVHFDGACEKVRGRRVAAYGFTIEGGGLRHDDFGLAVPPGHPRATNNVAEYVGAICGLEWLVRAGYTGPVVVVGDSQLVVRQMQGEYRVRAEHLVPYHARLGQLVAVFPHVEFRWVPREENTRADELSKRGLELGGWRANLRPEGGSPTAEPSRRDDQPQRTV